MTTEKLEEIKAIIKNLKKVKINDSVVLEQISGLSKKARKIEKEIQKEEKYRKEYMQACGRTGGSVGFERKMNEKSLELYGELAGLLMICM